MRKTEIVLRKTSGPAALLLCLLMAGCTLGPDYRRAEMDIPAAFENEGLWQQAAPADEGPRGPWWSLFGDATLDGLVARAAAANPNLAAAAARLDQSRSLLQISRADALPRLDLNAQAVRSRTSADFAFGRSQTQTRLALPVDLSYEVDLWGRVRRSNEAALARYQGSVAGFDALHLSLQAEVADRYFSLREQDAQMALLEQTLVLRRRNLELVQSLFDNGRTSRLDLDRAKAELAGAEADLEAVRRERMLLENSLALLLGAFPSDFRLEPAPLSGMPPAVARELPSTLLERRPDVAAAERAMAEANARIGVARAAFYPRVSLGAGAGFAATNLGSLFEADSRTWALGPLAGLPLFDGGRNRANLLASEAALREAGALYRRQVLGAFTETENSLAQLRTLQDQSAAQDRAVDSAQQAAELSRTRYRAGLVSYLEVIDSERSVLQGRRQQSRLLGERYRATVALVKALGGGWENPGL